MTPEAQRIAIAKACGLGSPYKIEPKGRGVASKIIWTIPDYLGDLNAMHKAEKVLTDLGLYVIELGRAVDRSEGPQKDHNFAIVHATAAQRAQAFLRTLGLWKE